MQETGEENEFLKNAEYFYSVCKKEYETDKSVRCESKQTKKSQESMKNTVTFVIGATATGKTTFIKKHFSDKTNTVIFNVYDYQQAAYKEAGFGEYIPFGQEFRCLYRANENLLNDIISALEKCKSVVVEQTFYKAKRRIAYMDTIRNAVENVTTNVYVMSPSDSVWEKYVSERKLTASFGRLKKEAEQIEFPNPVEGFDQIYEVTDKEIRLRMDDIKTEIVKNAHKELSEENEQMKHNEDERRQRLGLLKSMGSRQFWHYCEVCGKKVYCTAKEAYDAGWDYPPQMGTFGLLSPRICGGCSMESTLWWKVQQQNLPIVIEKKLTKEELKTWRRIQMEPESLLETENEP